MITTDCGFHSYNSSHTAGHVGQDHLDWQCWKNIQYDRMEGIEYD